MLVEEIKHPVRLVECGAQNIKITTRDDLVFAESLLKKREKEKMVEDL